jgi:hypothetical protein
MTLNVCGNSDYNSPTYTCEYFSLGAPGIGVWTDWVLYVDLQVALHTPSLHSLLILLSGASRLGRSRCGATAT